MHTKINRWKAFEIKLLKECIRKQSHLTEMMSLLERTEPAIRKKLKQLGYEPKTIYIKEKK